MSDLAARQDSRLRDTRSAMIGPGTKNIGGYIGRRLQKPVGLGKNGKARVSRDGRVVPLPYSRWFPGRVVRVFGLNCYPNPVL